MQHAKGYPCARAHSGDQKRARAFDASRNITESPFPPFPPLPPAGRVRAVRVRMTITLVKNKENCGGRILYLPRPHTTRFFMLFIFSISRTEKAILATEACKMFASDGSSEFILPLSLCDYDSKG